MQMHTRSYAIFVWKNMIFRKVLFYLGESIIFEENDGSWLTRADPLGVPKSCFFCDFCMNLGAMFFFVLCSMFGVIFWGFGDAKTFQNHAFYDTKCDFACYQKVIILAWFLTIKNQPWTSNFIIFRRHILLKILMRKNWKHQIRVVYATLREGQCFANFIEFSNFSCSFLLLSFDPLRDHFSSILMVPETI